jgi:hypothetical protein
MAVSYQRLAGKKIHVFSAKNQLYFHCQWKSIKRALLQFTLERKKWKCFCQFEKNSHRIIGKDVGWQFHVKFS